jgi:hypothetical protein
MNYKQDNNLSFLKSKIIQIKIALFKSESDFELQLPNNIIQTLRVEDDGTIWFFTTCNGNHARFMNRSFHASLNYYRKDTGCHLQLAGKACIINDVETEFAADNDFSTDAYTSVLIKMKIMQAEFFGNKAVSEITWAEKIKAAVAGLFLSPAHRVYNFS